MKTIVVGGQSRDVGKTAAVAGLVRAFAEWDWTAVKITQFDDDERAIYGESWSLEEDRGESGATDTGRFLAAGARRAYWLRAPSGRLGEAMPALRAVLAGARNAIIESNSVLEFLTPDLFLMVLGPGALKPSARKFLDRADAYLLVGGAAAPGERPAFRFAPGEAPAPEIVALVAAVVRSSGL